MKKPVFKKKRFTRSVQPAKPHPSYNTDARILLAREEEKLNVAAWFSFYL